VESASSDILTRTGLSDQRHRLAVEAEALASVFWINAACALRSSR
jgi:predicted mannosyl-3-phosphoglycerate phosphatase (HAD superfamily)